MSQKNPDSGTDFYGDFFDKVFEPESVSGGIIDAKRSNASEVWDEDDDAERGKKNTKAFIEVFDAATAPMAKTEEK